MEMVHSNQETILFRVKSGTTPQQVEFSNESVNHWLKSREGFIYRSLSHDPQKDLWIDTIYWQSEAMARKAGEAFMGAPETADYIGLIEEGSVNIYHADIHLDLSNCG